MLGWRFVLSIVLVAMTTFLSMAPPPGGSRAGDHAAAGAEANKEFQAQVAAIVQAYRKHDPVKGRQLIDQFRLPNAHDWFAAHLNPARSDEFTSRYDRLYTNFADSFELTIKISLRTRVPSWAPKLRLRMRGRETTCCLAENAAEW
jgi:hypothetical protein